MKKIRLRLIYLLMLILFLPACATTPYTKTSQQAYEEWLSTCKNYKDVDRWMAKNFVYDMNRLRFSMSGLSTRSQVEIYSPEETFKLKSGVCMEAAVFVKHSLNRINPDYKAEIVHLYPGVLPDHYVCGFYVDGKLLVMDRGTTYRSMEGVHGPYTSLDEYARFYVSYHPVNRKLKWCKFG